MKTQEIIFNISYIAITKRIKATFKLHSLVKHVKNPNMIGIITGYDTDTNSISVRFSNQSTTTLYKEHELLLLLLELRPTDITKKIVAVSEQWSFHKLNRNYTGKVFETTAGFNDLFALSNGRITSYTATLKTSDDDPYQENSILSFVNG